MWRYRTDRSLLLNVRGSHGHRLFPAIRLLWPNSEGPEGLTRANAREQSISLWESGEFTPRGSVIPFNWFFFSF